MLIDNAGSSGQPRRFSRLRKSAVATVTGLALALGSVSVAPLAEAQQNVQPDYPDDSRDWDPTIAFGAGQPIADNPVLPSDQCGGEKGNLKIALVFDLSTSIGTKGLEESKTAGKAVVEALNDAPVQIGIYNFGSRAPSDFASEAQTKDGPAPQGSQEALTAIIDKLSIPSTGVEGTNWDRGIGQIPLGTYDVVYFITDGLPTTFDLAKGGERGLYNRPAYNHNYKGKANKDYAAAKNDVQRAVASANALKESGTRLVPLAVGNDVNDNEIAKTYLEYISGEGDWVPVTNFDTLATELVKQATEGCAGEVVIQKQLTDATGKPTNDSLAGFAFQASGISEKFHFTNTTATTDEDGKATFGYVAPNNTAKGSFTITEVGAEFKNVSCTSADGDPWERKDNSFIVPAKAGGQAECTVNNPAPVTVTVTETTTEAPSTVTEATTAEPITTTVTEIPEVVTTVETETVTETPEPSTVEKTVTQTPDSVTVTETPDTVTVTEVPNPATETVTETPDVETETVTVTTTETLEPTPTTVTQTTTQTETATATQTETETATATETATETETQTDTTTATTTATDTQVVTTTETTTVTGEPVTEVQTVTPAPVTETVTAEVTVVNEVPGEQVTVTNTSTVTETIDNTVEKTVEKTINNTVTETVDNTIEKTVDNVITSVIQGEPVTVTNNATVTETQTETTTVVSDREPSAATATVTVTATETQVVTTTVGAGAGDTGAKETVTVTTTAALFPGSSNDGGILGGSSNGDIQGGSSEDGIVDDRCIPAVIGLGIPLLATIPLSLLQQVSIPGLDAYSAEINSHITQANNQIQQQLGIFDENTARMVQEFNAQVNRIGAENQQILQWAGISAAIVGVASYLFYFCVPRPNAEQGSSN